MNIHVIDAALKDLADQPRAAADDPAEAAVYDAAWRLLDQDRQNTLATMTDAQLCEYEIKRHELIEEWK